MKRRDFLKNSVAATAGILSVPAIVPSLVFGKYRPNDKINIGQIGCGRIARAQDIPWTIENIDLCRYVAVADWDIKRAHDRKKQIEDFYTQKTGKAGYVNVKVYQNYQEMLQDPSIDAVVISTPDHWHAQPAMEAALAGKDIYLQKPASLTIEEGRQMSDTVHRTGTIFQVGSQQRSLTEPQFHHACELVRNGRIGQIKHIRVGLGKDPGCGDEPEMPVPPNLDYNSWLGSTPEVYYTEKRVHPQEDYSRPGWLRCRQFGAGMITGWGAHHIDIAHWGMGTEYTGPVEIEGEAEYPKSGLWDVHGKFTVNAKYANGVTMEVTDRGPRGVRFEGTDGWIFVSRGSKKVTSSDPGKVKEGKKAIDASDPKILESKIGPNEIHLYESPEQHLDWLNCIRTRQQPVAPVEVAHRSCSACLLSDIAMQIPHTKLYWDPQKERFLNNDQANAMLSRPQRYPFGTNYVKA